MINQRTHKRYIENLRNDNVPPKLQNEYQNGGAKTIRIFYQRNSEVFFQCAEMIDLQINEISNPSQSMKRD